jgi:hypothetical protein
MSAQGAAHGAPSKTHVASHGSDTINDSRKVLRDYLNSFEDAALLAGGLLATISGYLGSGSSSGSDPSPGLVVVGLSVSAIGKSIPSLFTYLAWDRKADDRGLRAMSAFADAFFFFFGAFGVLYYCFDASRSLSFFLLLIGMGFAGKAIVDIIHDLIWAKAQNGKKVTLPGGGPTEDFLFLMFGLAAILLSIPVLASALGASPALGIAALGKALPSLLKGNSTGGDGSNNSRAAFSN